MTPTRKYRKSNLTDEIREQIALEYLTTPLSYSQVGAKYGVSKLQVRHCLVCHERQELLAVVNNPNMPRLHSPEMSDLAKQNKGLQKRLEIALLKAEAYDTMIRLAEGPPEGGDPEKEVVHKEVSRAWIAGLLKGILRLQADL